MPFVVLTRDAVAAAPYATALAALGFDAIAMPVTRTAPPADPDALARAIARPHDAVMVASPRAASALVTASAGLGYARDVWAVGPATARVLADGNLVARQPAPPDGPDLRDGAALARAILAAYPVGARILVPRAAEGREEGVAILRAGGAIVDEVIAYRTLPAPHDDPALAEGRARLAAGEVAVCAVFAPSQVAALARLVGSLAALAAGAAGAPGASGGTRFAAIGQTTAAALAAAGVTRVAIAEAPTPEGLARAIAAAGMAAARAPVYPPGR